MGAQSGMIQQASQAFESMNRRIAQATLNTTYFDYYPYQVGSDTPQTPLTYIRRSGLHFLSGQGGDLVPGGAQLHPTHSIFFQAPLGLTEKGVGDADYAAYSGLGGLLNACGYFIEYGSDANWIPNVKNLRERNQTKRFRLMELIEPSKLLKVYDYCDADGKPVEAKKDRWLQSALSATADTGYYYRPVAENIIALVVLPKYSDEEQSLSGLPPLSTDYTYDTRDGDRDDQIHPSENPPQKMQNNQLPPILRIAMVVIDEASAQKLAREYGDSPPPLVAASLFQDTSKFDDDMAQLSKSLGEKRINYRVFASEVPLRSAKWNTSH